MSWKSIIYAPNQNLLPSLRMFMKRFMNVRCIKRYPKSIIKISAESAFYRMGKSVSAYVFA